MQLPRTSKTRLSPLASCAPLLLALGVGACSGGSGDDSNGDGGPRWDIDAGDPCLPNPCTGLANTRCRAGRCVAGELKLSSGSPQGTLAGTYSYFSTMPALSFSAVLDGAGGAQATMGLAGGADQVTVKLTGKDQVQLSYAGATMSGNGALSPQASAALAQLSASPLYQAAVLTSLELGCQGKAEPPQLAALVAPWQMVLKHMVADRATHARDLAKLASCAYFADPAKPTGAPAPGLLRLSFDDPIPNVFGIFPFDATGALERASSGQPLTLSGSTSGPCGALCRGACGPDCTTNNCNLKGTGRCQLVHLQKNGYWETATIYNCGTHQGCRDHDDCYDICNENRCNTWAAATCRRGCDIEACRTWPGECTYWARGYGTFDGRLDFTYWDPPRYDPLICPLPAATDGPMSRDAGSPDVARLPDAATTPDLAPDRPADAPAPDGPAVSTWRLTKFEPKFEPHDSCSKQVSASNGSLVVSNDCLLHNGQTFSETDTITWTPPPDVITVKEFQPYDTVWWTGNLSASAVLSIPATSNAPRACVDLRATQSSHPADSYRVTLGASPCVAFATPATGSFQARDGGSFQRDFHAGNPPPDPSPVVVKMQISTTMASAGYYVFHAYYTYTRQ